MTRKIRATSEGPEDPDAITVRRNIVSTYVVRLFKKVGKNLFLKESHACTESTLITALAFP